MRAALFYNPLLLLERLGQWATEQSRLRKLRGTVAKQLQGGHIDSLELLQLLRPLSPKVIYDVGANVGTWTLLARAIFPDSEIHAFEPLDQLKDGFLQRTKGLHGIYYHSIALGARTALMPMKLTDFVDASSLLEMTRAQERYFNVHRAGEKIVRVERLDDYVRQSALPPPDLIKLDIQGYEVEALKGAEECLEKSRAVLSEVSFMEFYKGQGMFHDLVSFLAKREFYTRAFSVKTSLGTLLLQTDVLFEKNIPESTLGKFAVS